MQPGLCDQDLRVDVRAALYIDASHRQCRAGARYLYICENGLVHWCSQQRGTPGVPLATYTLDDIRREFLTPKWCAPMCTIGCVHRVSTMDYWRKPQKSDPGVAAGPVSQAS